MTEQELHDQLAGLVARIEGFRGQCAVDEAVLRVALADVIAKQARLDEQLLWLHEAMRDLEGADARATH